jgi:hypothetical protein
VEKEDGWGDGCGSKDERENAILPGRRAIQCFTGLHDSFYHGPICHHIDNCLEMTARACGVIQEDVANGDI